MIEPCDRTNANQFTLENRHYFQRYQQVVGGGQVWTASFIAQSISLFNITFIAFRKIKTWNPWTEAETMAINAAFMTHISRGIVPLVGDVYKVLDRYPVLKKREVQKIKDKVRNTLFEKKEKD